MLVFEFRQKKYVALEMALKKIIKLPLDSVLADIADQLCFFYQDTVLLNGKTAGFQGMVFPEKALMTTRQIGNALKYADKHAPPSLIPTLFDDTGKLRPLTAANREAYKPAFMNTGKASSNNALLLGNSIDDTQFFEHRDSPPCVFYLRHYVLPYYLLPLDFLKEYIERTGIIADFSMFGSFWNNPQTVPVTQIDVERGSPISDTKPRLTGDALWEAINSLTEHKRTAENAMKEQAGQLQEFQAKLIEAHQENTNLRLQLDNLRAEAAGLQQKAPLRNQQTQREAILEKLLLRIEEKAESLAQQGEEITFNRKVIRATKEDVLQALKQLEAVGGATTSLFSIAQSSFNDFWKKQQLCSLATGRGHNADVALMDSLFDC